MREGRLRASVIGNTENEIIAMNYDSALVGFGVHFRMIPARDAYCHFLFLRQLRFSSLDDDTPDVRGIQAIAALGPQ